jgi:hypothetical protein
MKNWKRIIVGLAIFSTLQFTACVKERDLSPMTCQLETAQEQFIEESIDVVYTLTGQGDCTVESFYYYDESGKVTINNPPLPSTFTTTLSSQKIMQAGASATVTEGVVQIGFMAQSNLNVYESSDLCQQSKH